MSVTPNNTLPKRTRTAVIDLLFMEKYQLTKTQMLVMYYLLMLKNWVPFVDNGFYVILSSKIEQDLQLHPKTVEASITNIWVWVSWYFSLKSRSITAVLVRLGRVLFGVTDIFYPWNYIQESSY